MPTQVQADLCSIFGEITNRQLTTEEINELIKGYHRDEGVEMAEEL